MGRMSRDKGSRGEREVAAIYAAAGLEVRSLEGGGRNAARTSAGDHLVVCADGVTLHSETKRQETTRPWHWLAQAEADAPAGTVPTVAFRRNHGRWYVMLPLDDFAGLAARAASASASQRVADGYASALADRGLL